MIWFNFGRWSRSSGRIFVLKRLYADGEWTPFILIVLRCLERKPDFPGDMEMTIPSMFGSYIESMDPPCPRCKHKYRSWNTFFNKCKRCACYNKFKPIDVMKEIERINKECRS